MQKIFNTSKHMRYAHATRTAVSGQRSVLSAQCSVLSGQRSAYFIQKHRLR
ncbi:hypothetical protein [Moorena sp. SIO4G3]|uniref:hypothetical protein n=1 Tax=Moorena sp. SIO4G3 TaxID=2607821 RepID=UPI00142ADFC1|nr:hypothetical protein [Moorena sp. SIO4G3]NEO80785.1 hypothetical protein [Moorena sp. SIO4G3]